MNGWLTLWTTVLIAALTLFTCLTIAVTIGGFIDIRKMLRQIRRQHAERPTEDPDPRRGFAPLKVRPPEDSK
jgi:hypothetical protein